MIAVFESVRAMQRTLDRKPQQEGASDVMLQRSQPCEQVIPE